MIHREATPTLIISAIITLGLCYLAYTMTSGWILWLILALLVGLFLFIVSFFRNPTRIIAEPNESIIYAPADGKVVAIEEVHEPEYFNDKKLQISIFMSPANVHVNRNPISGTIAYKKYHPGKYLAAWNPKSSTENERTTIVYKANDTQILVRQIAGALARRIVNYLKEGDKVTQGGEMGFIKFGSRVDLYVPLGTKPLVKIDDVVRGNISKIAELS